jgi:hypothetical protein
MTALSALWLPILVSAVIVFVASSVIHMFLPWHKNDYVKMPNEDRAIDALRPLAIPPGDYAVPHCSGPEEMKSPAFKAKMDKGPVMIVTVRPNGMFAMMNFMVQWLVFCVVMALCSAFVAASALPVGTPYLRVFQVVAGVTFMGYALASWPLSIWYGRKWSTTLKSTFDAVIYALLTAGVFGWLWPR